MYGFFHILGRFVSLFYYDFVQNSAEETQIDTSSCSAMRSFIDQPPHLPLSKLPLFYVLFFVSDIVPVKFSSFRIAYFKEELTGNVGNIEASL
jgi:hypothetical protein